VTVTAAAASRFTVAAPATGTAGTAFDVTVTAYDPFGNQATGYLGSVHFGSSDPQGVVPANYAFTAGQSGSHVFAGGVTLKTAGTQSVTVTDTTAGSLTGQRSGIVVVPGAVTTLNYVQPLLAGVSGTAMAPAPAIKLFDAFGNLATNSTATVTMTIGANP